MEKHWLCAKKTGEILHEPRCLSPPPMALWAETPATGVGFTYNPVPGSTSLAKADTETRNYHNYFGPRWNPFIEHAFYFVYWIFISHVHLSKFLLGIIINTKMNLEWGGLIIQRILMLLLTLSSLSRHLGFHVSTLGDTANNIHNLIFNIFKAKTLDLVFFRAFC